MLIRIRIEHPRVQIAKARMLSAIDSIVYRLKVAEPHILNLGLFILASSSHLLYCLRVHIDTGRSSYGLSDSTLRAIQYPIIVLFIYIVLLYTNC